MSAALRELVERIHQGRAAGLLPAEWEALAQTALKEVEHVWESERAFRHRTGSSDKWCRENFERCLAAGLARRNDRGRREWHMHARLPRRGRDAAEMKRKIVQSFEEPRR